MGPLGPMQWAPMRPTLWPGLDVEIQGGPGTLLTLGPGVGPIELTSLSYLGAGELLITPCIIAV